MADIPCTACQDCASPPPVTCSDPTYTANTCPDVLPSDCVTYTGPDNSCIEVFNAEKPSVTTVIKKAFAYITTLLSRITSRSLRITTNGACPDSISVELVPSSQDGNILSLGSDGYPYVPPTIINMLPSRCFSWQRSTSGNTSSWVPVLDFTCISTNITNLLTCAAPTNVHISNITTTSATVNFDQTSGLSYDVVVGGVTTYADVASPYIVQNLTPAANYSIAVIVHCTGGVNSETIVAFSTLPILVCNTPSNLQISST